MTMIRTLLIPISEPVSMRNTTCPVETSRGVREAPVIEIRIGDDLYQSVNVAQGVAMNMETGEFVALRFEMEGGEVELEEFGAC